VIRGKRIVVVVGVVAGALMIAAGGATVASALGGSTSGLLTGRLDVKVAHHGLTKAQKHKLQLIRTSNVATRAQARRLLRALGLNPRGFVIQLGKRNYAGPNCPGKGWSCTNARRVLQAAGDNDFQCTQSTGPGAMFAPPGPCVVVQTNGGSAKCVERTKTSAAEVLQECSITQGPNASGDNRADILQVVEQTAGGSATQDATQNAFVMQTNGAGSNRSSVRQDVKQSIDSGAPAVDVTQEQNAHQRVFVTQITDNGTGQAGGNDSNVDQSQDQNEKAQKATNSITQLQNADDVFDNDHCPTYSSLDDEFSNQCAAVVQLSNVDDVDFPEAAIPGPHGGRNITNLQQHVNQDQDASKTLGGEQGQGSSDLTIGGLDHRFIQHSTGLSTQGSHQHENQKQHRSDTGAMTAYQHGPTRKGTGMQSGNPDNKANQNQDSKQESKGPGLIESTDVMTDQCESSGNCDADQKVDSNGNKAHNHQSGPFFVAFIACGTSDIFPGGGDLTFAHLLQEEVPPCTTSSDETTSVTTEG
jgi:hypothetical protein